MGYYRKWKPSKTQVKKFVEKMDEITQFCEAHNITQCRDSYYFELNGKNYRVSNHTIEASNSRAYNSMGEQVRPKYHPFGEKPYDQCITASKTRLIEIYAALEQGHKLSRRGYIID